MLPRLTAAQYHNAVEDLLGPVAVAELEADTNPYLFYAIGAASTPYSERGVQQLEEAAEQLSAEVFADPERRLVVMGCQPATPDDACTTGFVASFGQRAYRRPLTPEEQARWAQVAVDTAGGDPWRGAQHVVAGMLQSPHFVYRVELGEPDPGQPDRLRYTAWEMASRLSFLLWNSIPDAALLEAAGRGDLLDADGIDAQAARMLADPRARTATQEFFAQYLDLARLDDTSRDPVAYPDFDPSLVDAMRTEVRLLVDDLVFRRDADIRSLFWTDRTFVNEPLAAHYGLDAPGATAITYVPVQLPEDGPRLGLLTSGAFLTMNAHPVETSPTLRGKYLRERVLCQPVPAPPDDVDLDLSGAGGEAVTLRERLDQHRDDPACAGCHSFVDPPGYLFEHFDATGAYRTEALGRPIDSSGELDGVALADARSLAVLLRDSELIGPCMVKQLYRHAHSRLDTPAEAGSLEQIQAAFAASDHRFPALLRALVTHESFRYVVPAEGTP